MCETKCKTASVLNSFLSFFFNYFLQKMDDKIGKSELQKSIERDVKKKAKNIEKKSYEKTKEARLRFEKAHETQKGTTQRIRMMNENLAEAKGSGVKAYENAKKAKQQATILSNEKNAFNPLANAQSKFTNWKENDKLADEEIEKIENGKTSSDEGHGTDDQDESSNLLGEGNFDEERKTNEELNKILATAKSINRENAVQKNEGKKQKTNLKDIEKTAEYAKKETEGATHKLNDFKKNYK